MTCVNEVDTTKRVAKVDELAQAFFSPKIAQLHKLYMLTFQKLAVQ